MSDEVVSMLAMLRTGGGPEATAIPWPMVATATLCAFAGAFLGKRLLGKVTVTGLHHLIGGLLLLVGAALALGVV